MPAPLASDYALPAYAQTSPQDQVSFAMPTAAAQSWAFTADGDFVYLVTTVAFQFVASAGAGNRVILVTHSDAQGVALSLVPSPTAQAPTTGFSYTASVSVGNAYSITTGNLTFVYMPLPAIPLAAGMSLQVSGFHADDVVAAPFMTALRYSTEPTEVTTVAVPTPLPL